jgi:hypothetical protein
MGWDFGPIAGQSRSIFEFARVPPIAEPTAPPWLPLTAVPQSTTGRSPTTVIH